MNTNTFGHATGFVHSTETNLSQISGAFQSLQRLKPGFYAQNGQMTATTSPRLTLTGMTDLSRRRGLGRVAPVAKGPPDVGKIRRIQHPAALTLIEDIKGRTGLTLEEIASLLGTSRRTIHNWRAGERINSRNETRLRAINHAIRAMDAGDPRETRDRLFKREQGQISPYVLLIEQRYDTAIAIAIGHQFVRSEPMIGDGLRPEIAARLAIKPEGQPLSAGKRSQRRLGQKKS